MFSPMKDSSLPCASPSKWPTASGGPSNGKRGPIAGSQIAKRVKGAATPPVSQSVVSPSTGGINLDPVKSENDKTYAELAAAKARILSVSELCDLTTATPDFQASRRTTEPSRY